jgi:hypothetical protein
MVHVHTDGTWYHIGIAIRTYHWYVPWYPGTSCVPYQGMVRTYYVPWYVPWYHGTYVRTYVRMRGLWTIPPIDDTSINGKTSHFATSFDVAVAVDLLLHLCEGTDQRTRARDTDTDDSPKGGWWSECGSTVKGGYGYHIHGTMVWQYWYAVLSLTTIGSTIPMACTMVPWYVY